ncbi:MAG: DEAD/DEAH box helicase [Polyangiaceae bacterium]|nr:DEAD/DEAH box helicase [Polyangiaceae bacterium]
MTDMTTPAPAAAAAPEQGDTNAARPAPTFDVLPLSAEIRETLAEIGYVHPTPVQIAVWEPATRGRDAMVQARTGTGKTAAFGLPIVDHIVKRSLGQAQALVLCPTRELAVQVAKEVDRLGRRKNIRITAVYGGAPMQRQIDAIDGGAQVIVGTPGRVLDHLRRGTLNPKHIRLLVLDECDEMLSMGFERELTAILEQLPIERQTLLFSATMPPDIERIARTKLKSPELITLSGDHIGALEIQHYVYLVASDKVGTLLRIIEVENPEGAIVFCNTRDETERVAQALSRQGFDADWLNGDLPQSEREEVMARTREGKLRFLVATDVAARGIDISHLTHVINYDFPQETAAYVHRTGRTGRAGKTGTAISLITPQEIGGLYVLRLEYKIRPIERQLPSEGELKTRAEADLVAMLAEAFLPKGTHPDDLALARRLLTHDQAEVIVAGLLRDHLGARPSAKEEAAALRRAPKPTRAEGGAEGRKTSHERRREAAAARQEAAAAEEAPRAPQMERVPGRGERRGRRDEEGRERGPRGLGISAPVPEAIAAPMERIDATATAVMPEATTVTSQAAEVTEETSAPLSPRAPETPRTALPADEVKPKEPRRAEESAPSPQPQAAERPIEREPPAIAPIEGAPEATSLARDRAAEPRLRSHRALEPGRGPRGETGGRRSHEPRHETRGRAERGEGPRGFGGQERGPMDRSVRAAEHAFAAGEGDEPLGPAARPGRPALERRAPAVAGRGSPPLVRHADFTTWQLPEEEGDDEPILAEGRAPRRSFGTRDDRREAERADTDRFEPEGGRIEAPEDLVEIFINVGRRDGARASDFQRLLVERAGLGRSSVQRIRVRERNAFVSVRKDELAKALGALHGAVIAGKTASAEQARERSANGGPDPSPEGEGESEVPGT